MHNDNNGDLIYSLLANPHPGIGNSLKSEEIIKLSTIPGKDLIKVSKLLNQ